MGGGGGGGEGVWGGVNIIVQMFKMALLLFKEYKCAKLFWNTCINTERNGPDKLNLWPFYHLTFKVCPGPLTFPNKCFKWHYYSSRRNTYAKLFLNPRINIEVMAPTSSIYDHFIIWPSSVTLTFNLTQANVSNGHYYSSRRTPVQNYFEIHT